VFACVCVSALAAASAPWMLAVCCGGPGEALAAARQPPSRRFSSEWAPRWTHAGDQLLLQIQISSRCCLLRSACRFDCVCVCVCVCASGHDRLFRSLHSVRSRSRSLLVDLAALGSIYLIPALVPEKVHTLAKASSGPPTGRQSRRMKTKTTTTGSLAAWRLSVGALRRSRRTAAAPSCMRA
jgi:hypothetical protein